MDRWVRNTFCYPSPHELCLYTDFFLSLNIISDTRRGPTAPPAVPTEDYVLRVCYSLALVSRDHASSAATAEHLQQRPGVHPLLPSRPRHVQAQVPQDLRGAHLLARRLVVDGRARGVALGPGAGVYQVEGAAPAGRGGPGPPAAVAPVAAVDVVAVLQAAVPAVEGSRQGGALHSEIDPVAAQAGGCCINK